MMASQGLPQTFRPAIIGKKLLKKFSHKYGGKKSVRDRGGRRTG
jgi:hypothetical protein